ncbi:MAG: TetR/AcrR family transcriptional regulator [Gammaproteobacteria bacterium]|nr:TetR/AcrR family transcriptional regulator [Gammaproteobacteria bacterium]
MDEADETQGSRKRRYHHGDLRETLIEATRELLIEKGADGFTLADACRRAGVTTAAPYKHFRDKSEILEVIVESGFDELTRRSMEAAEANGPGTLAGIIAMGHAYIAFAVAETAVFRLMFGQSSVVKRAEEVENKGRACFGGVIAQVELYCQRNAVPDDARRIALELWTFVHGASCLVIDQDYEKVAPGLDVPALITAVTPRLLGIRT